MIKTYGSNIQVTNFIRLRVLLLQEVRRGNHDRHTAGIQTVSSKL